MCLLPHQPTTVKVTDSGTGNPTAVAASAANPVSVSPALTISGLTIVTPIDSGQSTTVTLSWSGGTSPYNVTLYTSTSSSNCTGLVQAGQNSAVSGTTTTFTQTPSATTSY